MFVAHRDPEQRWLDALGRVAPMREQASHLTIRWHGGTPDAPTGRWVIFECLPEDVARVFGQYDELYSDRVDGQDPMIQWARDYHQRTRAIPCPVWVVQGSGGGHPYQYTQVEQVFARAGLMPPELPPIGDLSYAEPDGRTWQALAQRSLINRRVSSQHDAREIARAGAERLLRQRLVDEAREAMTEAVQEALPSIMEAATPVTREDAAGTTARLDDEHLARYVETGELSLRA